MKESKKGEFYGNTQKTIHLEGITLTDTVYTHDYVDWHYHEHAYFTFILQGGVIEGNKKEVYDCPAGSLLFHNWQDPHYNIKPEGFTRGFHAELEKSWFDHMDFDASQLQGSLKINDPEVKLLMYRIFRESAMRDGSSELSVQSLLLQTLASLFRSERAAIEKKPVWVAEIRALLHDEPFEKHTLGSLASTVAIHPVHLSRDFHKYFHCGLGDYIRKIKVEKSLAMIADRKLDLTDIAFACGFADQSHFTRRFKEINGLTPSEYRKILFG